VVTDLLPPPSSPAIEEILCADDGSGSGGGRIDNPDDGPNDDSEPTAPRSSPSLGMYRAALVIGTIWILALFATLTIVLEFTRGHSKQWNPIPFPHFLYVNTAILLLSSVTIEYARLSLRAEASRRSARCLTATLLLGSAFLCGQITVWQELGSRGFHLDSGGASFFFYLMTATHAVSVWGGIIALVPVLVAVSRFRRGSVRQTTIAIVVPYWHFVSGLWLYVFALLVSVKR
jgi:cytochrome c oxidase subunit III